MWQWLLELKTFIGDLFSYGVLFLSIAAILVTAVCIMKYCPSKHLAVILTVISSCFFMVPANMAFNKRVVEKKPPDMPPIIITGEPVIIRTKGGLLEVATMRSTETITRKFPGLFLDTVVTINVPATYRYHVELAPEWKFIYLHAEKKFVAVAPPIQPSLPVAIDTSTMTIDANYPFSGKEKEIVIRHITQGLSETAHAYMPRQKEDARKTIKEFLEKWVVGEDKWKNTQGLDVVVLFPDEPISDILKRGLYPVPALLP